MPAIVLEVTTYCCRKCGNEWTHSQLAAWYEGRASSSAAPSMRREYLPATTNLDSFHAYPHRKEIRIEEAPACHACFEEALGTLPAIDAESFARALARETEPKQKTTKRQKPLTLDDF